MGKNSLTQNGKSEGVRKGSPPNFAANIKEI